MADVPLFTVLPSLRCSYSFGDPEHLFCGAHATWMDASSIAIEPRFVCGVHRGPGDVPIAGELTVRRVQLFAEIVFAGIVPSARLAQLEALMRLTGAVEGVGGLVNLQGALSQLGRWRVPLAVGAGKATGERG